MGIVFVAKSGNVAHIRFAAEGKGGLVVDFGWESTPTDDDIQECDAWIDPQLMRLAPNASLQTLRIDDPAARAAAALSLSKEETEQ